MNRQPRFEFAVEYVTDIEAAKRFYVDVLGLQVERSHPTFVQFRNFALATDEPMAAGKDVELFWVIDDAEASYRELSQKAEVAVPLKTTPFGKVFGIKDPAGQPRYLVEFAKDRPSKPV